MEQGLVKWFVDWEIIGEEKMTNRKYLQEGNNNYYSLQFYHIKCVCLQESTIMHIVTLSQTTQCWLLDMEERMEGTIGWLKTGMYFLKTTNN